MPRDPRAYLYDILQACRLLQEFSRGKTYDDYAQDTMLRSAVERQFEIVGEALNQMRRETPDVAESISEHRQIIAFRNILIHGYAVVDDRVVWDLLQHRVDDLVSQVAVLLGKGDAL